MKSFINSCIKYKRWMMLTFIGIVLWLTIINVLTDGYNKKRETYLQAEMNSLSSKMTSILQTYEKFSDFIFRRIVNQPEVLEKVSNAKHGDDNVKDIMRKELYKLLKSEYDLITEYDFRQLHFHMPNGDSFLRFHIPEKYGDNLMAVRESIRIVNTEKRYVFGFEEGRIYNGYRFVYPLFNQGSHIGSVEVSISMASIMEVMSELYPEIDTAFIIDKKVVEDTVWTEKQGNYEEHPILTGFMLDKEVQKKQMSQKFNFTDETKGALLKKLLSEEPNVFDSRESFSRLLFHDGKQYIVQFIAIKNISGIPVAYFMGISENQDSLEAYGDLRRDLMLVTLVFLLLFVSTFIYTKKQNELEELSSTDKLTGLFNRHKFAELAERELQRSERYGSEMTLVMLDVDHFKRINDTYGHNSGDMVLQTTANIIMAAVRKQDIVARWGGEEFVVLLPETSFDNGVLIAERLREEIASHKFEGIGTVTASFGVAAKYGHATFDDWLNAADSEMYRAKEEGRNRICSQSIAPL